MTRMPHARPFELLDRDWCHHHFVLDPHYPNCLLRWKNLTGNKAFLNFRPASPKPRNHGYLMVGIQGEDWLQHIVIFAMHHDVWSDAEFFELVERMGWEGGEIDHIDRIRTHNHWDNLKVTDRHGQTRNSAGRSPHGFGVTLFKNGRFVAKTKRNGRTHNLGYYDTAEQARAAYAAGVSAFESGATRDAAISAAKRAGAA